MQKIVAITQNHIRQLDFFLKALMTDLTAIGFTCNDSLRAELISADKGVKTTYTHELGTVIYRIADSVAYIELIKANGPSQAGLGTALFDAWAGHLPVASSYVVLDPIDDENVRRFWRKLGFTPLYATEDPDIDLPPTLVKATAGGPNPGPFRYEVHWDNEPDFDDVPTTELRKSRLRP